MARKPGTSRAGDSKVSEYNREYYLKNKEKQKERNATYAKNNPDIVSEQHRRSYLKHRERYLFCAAQWRLANPEKYRAIQTPAQHRRRHRKVNGAIIPQPETINEILEWMFDNSDKCFYCTNPSEVIDHFFPISKGGSDSILNKVAACHFCNSRKSNKVFSTRMEVVDYLISQ
jgi:5-methylcytosine-specific restriction endonuclease McrA